MDESENPYSVLGVSPDATDAEIRSAYRKLALRHHPDKQRDEASRQEATVKFAKIANAYEILSDATQRRQFDYEQQPRPQRTQQSHQQQGFPDHDFFHSSFHHNHHFHDPFEVFERVFREEFGGGSRGPRRSFFDDQDGFRSGFPSSMMDPFGMMGGRGGGLFPGFGGGLFGGGFPGGFPGFGDDFGRDPFGDVFQSMHNNSHNRGNSTFSTYSVSTSSSSSGRGGESVTTQTTTRTVNGQTQTVTERIVRKPDGTVERQILENGGNSRARITNDPPAAAAAALPLSSHLPARRRRSSTKQQSTSSSGAPHLAPNQKRSKRGSQHEHERT